MAARSDAAAAPGPKDGAFMSLQLFPPGCESPELRSPRPPLKPHANPYLLKHGPPPPPTLPHQRKGCELFLCNSSVPHTGEWACTNHL